MRWVVQNNLLNTENQGMILETCARHGYSHESIKVIPFSTEVPDIDNSMPTVFYGGTNFIKNIQKACRWNPGTFFDPEKFNIRAYMENYREYMFNHPCEIATIGRFSASHQPHDKMFFIRPVKDLKEFAGEVMEFNKIIKWEKQLRYLPGCDNNPELTPDTEIAFSEPFNIAHEWRVFIVDGKVSSGSHYRSYMKLDIKGGLPEGVADFVEQMCRLWTPSDVFVMDIGESSGNLFIIECNCFNSSGFYKSDVEKIIVDISEFVLTKGQRHGT